MGIAMEKSKFVDSSLTFAGAELIYAEDRAVR